MKTKLVLWGSNAQDERLLIALELRPEHNMVNVFTFPEGEATEAFSQRMLNEWRDGKPVEFPELFTQDERVLSITESMLPEGLKVERDDILQRAQTEWHFIVLSSKLNETYINELGELRERVDNAKRFEESLWDELKGFWDKVQGQVRDRNLSRDQANDLRDKTNELFAQMKTLRTRLDEEFEHLSKDNHDKFLAALEEVEDKVKKGMRLQPIFEELKNMQIEFRKAKMTRDHRSAVWESLDATFKKVKEKRFGSTAADDRSPQDRLKRRYEGLLSAIDKMQRSIKRDRDDLAFENDKIARTDGQLEAQIRKAKIMMIEERIRSKEEKLGEMMQTKTELDRRMDGLREKEAKRAEQERLEDARRKAQKKIAEEIKQAAAARHDDSDKLEKAAETLRDPQAPSKPQTPPAPAGGELLNEVVDNLQAMAAIVSGEIESGVRHIEQEQPVETPSVSVADHPGEEAEEESGGEG